jgi:hypothetical protein
MKKVFWIKSSILAVFILMLALSCTKVEQATITESESVSDSQSVSAGITTQPATNISANAATLNGTVNANYLSTIVTFEYGTSTDYGLEVSADQSPVTGNTINNVSATLTGLTGGTNYCFRVKAVNSSGTSYGDNNTFNSAQHPVLITTPVSEITETTAISGGNITNDGGAPITDRGVYWSQSLPIRFFGSGKQPSSPHTHDGAGSGSFLSNLTGLQPSKTYYVRSYAVNSAGMALGDLISFTTLPSTPPCGQVPIAATLEATNISSNGAILNGTVNANGLSTIVTFEYGVWVGGKPGWIWWRNIPAIQSPVTATTLINVSTDITGLRGLRSGTRHPFRVKAVNSCGIVYGDILTFTLH